MLCLSEQLDEDFQTWPCRRDTREKAFLSHKLGLRPTNGIILNSSRKESINYIKLPKGFHPIRFIYPVGKCKSDDKKWRRLIGFDCFTCIPDLMKQGKGDELTDSARSQIVTDVPSIDSSLLHQRPRHLR